MSNWSWTLPEPAQIPPVDPDEFATAFNLVVNAATGRVALEHQLGEAPNPVARAKHWMLADKPLNRGLAALRERYTDPIKFNYMALRVAALTFAIARSELDHWVQPDPDEVNGRLVHPAVLDAAALTRLTDGYEFVRAEFRGNIERIAEEKYKAD